MTPIDRVRVPGNIDIEYQQAGSGGRSFVLVHGFTGSRDDWREHIEPLAQLGRTLAVDLRGHGGSTNPGDAAGYTLDQLSSDLHSALLAIDGEPCDLLGHSMGGMVALRYALDHPERVEALLADNGPIAKRS
jgi:pimeloyl-ACP methyl ester carboxylesterase